MPQFIKITLWSVAVALIGLGLIYFSYQDNRERFFKTEKQLLAEQAEQLKADNETVLEQIYSQELQPVAPISAADNLWGQATAPVHLIVYVDYDCPFCAEYQQTLKQVKDKYGDQLVIAFRHYPLATHANAIPKALAAECAAEQDQFLAMADKLYQGQVQPQTDQTAVAIQAAEELKLDMEAFKKCLLEQRYLDKIVTDKNQAEGFGVTGTPTSFLGLKVLPGAYQFQDFQDQTGRQYEGLETLIDKLLIK